MVFWPRTEEHTDRNSKRRTYPRPAVVLCLISSFDDDRVNRERSTRYDITATCAAILPHCLERSNLTRHEYGGCSNRRAVTWNCKVAKNGVTGIIEELVRADSEYSDRMDCGAVCPSACLTLTVRELR